jgi:hypothetical protein
MLLVVPGGDGLASTSLGGGLPPEVMAAIFERCTPLSLTVGIGLAAGAGSWWGWDKFTAGPEDAKEEDEGMSK